MADYSYVELGILAAHKEKAEKIIKNFMYVSINDLPRPEIEDSVNIIYYEFDEVRWGELPFLDTLTEEGIPYSAITSGDYNISPVDRHCRFTDEGKIEIREIYEDSDVFKLPYLKALAKEDDFKEVLLEKMAQMEKNLHITSWTNQEENVKKYLINKLLGE